MAHIIASHVRVLNRLRKVKEYVVLDLGYRPSKDSEEKYVPPSNPSEIIIDVPDEQKPSAEDTETPLLSDPEAV